MTNQERLIKLRSEADEIKLTLRSMNEQSKMYPNVTFSIDLRNYLSEELGKIYNEMHMLIKLDPIFVEDL